MSAFGGGIAEGWGVGNAWRTRRAQDWLGEQMANVQQAGGAIPTDVSQPDQMGPPTREGEMSTEPMPPMALTRDYWGKVEKEITKGRFGAAKAEALKFLDDYKTKGYLDNISKGVSMMDADPQAAARYLTRAFSYADDGNMMFVQPGKDGKMIFMSADEKTKKLDKGKVRELTKGDIQRDLYDRPAQGAKFTETQAGINVKDAQAEAAMAGVPTEKAKQQYYQALAGYYNRGLGAGMGKGKTTGKPMTPKDLAALEGQVDTLMAGYQTSDNPDYAQPFLANPERTKDFLMGASIMNKDLEMPPQHYATMWYDMAKGDAQPMQAGDGSWWINYHNNWYTLPAAVMDKVKKAPEQAGPPELTFPQRVERKMQGALEEVKGALNTPRKPTTRGGGNTSTYGIERVFAPRPNDASNKRQSHRHSRGVPTPSTKGLEQPNNLQDPARKGVPEAQ